MRHAEFQEREKTQRIPAAYLTQDIHPFVGMVNIFMGTIQEFHQVNELWNEDRRGLPRIEGSVMGVSLDSAYYLSGLQFEYPIEFSMMTFPAICGKWQLPSNQGYAQVYANMDQDTNIEYYVCMTASG